MTHRDNRMFHQGNPIQGLVVLYQNRSLERVYIPRWYFNTGIASPVKFMKICCISNPFDIDPWVFFYRIDMSFERNKSENQCKHQADWGSRANTYCSKRRFIFDPIVFE